MATLQNIGVLKYRGKDGNWKPLPVVLQSSGGGGSGGISTISGNGQPTESTVGQLNQLYRDELTDKLYICTGVEGGYTWEAVVSDTEDAVTYTAQTLTEEQKTQARANIGAGTSNFSGSYNDLNDQPNIPAATVIDTTLTKSGQAADAKAAGDAIGKKLDATALPTAVNDALAQAKASGAFDGEKGDTGPVGPKGADGKDGAGMDITGAKVGQIAKITAVDGSGKPTAWEAVDMPSGSGSGGKQLLYRHNISQDTVLTTDSFDTSGANIDLSVYSHLYIRCMFICNSPTETYGCFYLNGLLFSTIRYFNRKSGQTIGFEADIVCLKTQNESSAGLLSFAWCSEFNLEKFDETYVENKTSKSRINGNMQSIGFSAVESSDIFAVKAGSYVEVWGD